MKRLGRSGTKKDNPAPGLERDKGWISQFGIGNFLFGHINKAFGGRFRCDGLIRGDEHLSDFFAC